MDPAQRARTGDAFLDERLDEYDEWLERQEIPFSAKVVPVGESFTARQWVLPTERVLEFLRNARSFALTDCICRTNYQRCDKPADICFLLNDAADRLVERGAGRRISLEQAKEALVRANEHGLVHLTLYNPQQHPYAICSCCSCCCHDLQMLQLLGRKDLIAHSEYVAVTDDEACTQCGACVDRCPFEARRREDGRVIYDPTTCYGCGLCVTICPAGATSMHRRHGRKEAKK